MAQAFDFEELAIDLVAAESRRWERFGTALPTYTPFGLLIVDGRFRTRRARGYNLREADLHLLECEPVRVAGRPIEGGQRRREPCPPAIEERLPVGRPEWMLLHAEYADVSDGGANALIPSEAAPQTGSRSSLDGLRRSFTGSQGEFRSSRSGPIVASIRGPHHILKCCRFTPREACIPLE